MRPLYVGSAILLTVVAAACADAPTPVSAPTPPPTEAPHAIGVYTIEVTGIGTEQMTSRVVQPASLGDGVRTTITNAGSGVVLENVSATSFNEGSRSAGGERYVSFVYRVRNGTGTPLTNLTLLPVSNASTISGTPISSIKRVDGTNADPSIAALVVPTGAVALGGDAVTVQALYPDVLQVLSEAEVAAITPPAGVTNIFPVGWMVRSNLTTANRTLPVPTDPNEFDGRLTLSFRMPLQPTAAQDVSSIFFQVLMVTDDQTRLTESIEESQDSGAVRRLRDRATSLGATMVTVLNGSPAMDPAVPDYPGQRQICSPRTAGTAASPTTTIVAPAGYSNLLILNPGESVDNCGPYFRTGTPGRPATNVPYTLTVKAMDRYGNVKTAQVDTVHMDAVSGPPYVAGASAALVSGSATQTVTYSDYGTSLMAAIGRRLTGTRILPVAGVTHTWTAGAGTTDWFTPTNWSPAAVPMSLDSVYIPAAAPLYPALTANVSIAGVTVEDVAAINLGAFDLTASGNVSTGFNGGITNTSGRLFLAGVAQTVGGKVAPLRVTGTYSLTANVNARAAIQVDAGRLTVSALRLQADSY